MQHEQDGASTNKAFKRLAAKIADGTATVGIYGLGYVGLPLSLAIFARSTYPIVGFDIDPVKVEMLGLGQSYLKHLPSDLINRMVKSGRFLATTDMSASSNVDVALLCVPTPLNRHREPDLSYVTGTTEAILPYARPGQLIVLESTTYPRTTSDLIVPMFDGRGLVSGRDIFLAYSPEREDPGNTQFETSTIPKVIGGEGPLAAQLAAEFYGRFVKQVVPVSSTACAEAVKLTENIFRAVNIALVNELKIVFEAMGVDIWEVIDAAKTKPFGFMPFYPGPGLGGHCIPIDPFYLTWKAREYDISTRFIELAGEINTTMPRLVVERLAQALDEQAGRGLQGARILVVGLAYKKNIDDLRESPSLKLIEILEARGAHVDYHDPYIPVIPPTREHARLALRKSASILPEALASADVVLVSTDHDEIDYASIAEHARLIVDTRNVFARKGLRMPNIVKA